MIRPRGAFSVFSLVSALVMLSALLFSAIMLPSAIADGDAAVAALYGAAIGAGFVSLWSMLVSAIARGSA
jgi:hypothetical protein